MVSWKQLAKYLSGEAGEKEKSAVEHWVNRHPNHRKSFEETKMYWNKIENQQQSSINVDAAWDKLHQKISREEGDSGKQQMMIGLQTRLFKYAAALVLLIGLGVGGFYAYQGINQAVNTVKVQSLSDQGTKQVYLPDGSMAHLYYNSRVIYPKDFLENHRNVRIKKGEVYFDVERNPERPFVISARDARIEVLGTSFNVNTNFPDQKVEVYVQSGKVKLSRENEPGKYLILEPGYKGILTPSSLKKVKNTDNNYIAWTTGKLTFKDQPLGQVLQTLMRTYHVDIHTEDASIKNYKITTHFTQEPIDTVLAVIATTFNLEVTQRQNDTYVLRADGKQ
ncbi:MAG TPA: FecR domain-containing protein [Bacteroidales bacterium]|nr:FecR domain-containing protein [Bacteroidales bacterium]